MSGSLWDGGPPLFSAHMMRSWVVSFNTVIPFGCSVILNTLRVFLVVSCGRAEKSIGVRMTLPASWNFLTLLLNIIYIQKSARIVSEQLDGFSQTEHSTHVKERNVTSVPSFQSPPHPKGTRYPAF